MNITGFATPYATPLATGYFPGSGQADPPATGSGYGTAYACNFATAYLPGSGQAGVVTPPLPADLWDAIEDLVARMVTPGGPFTWAGDTAPYGTMLPYLVMGRSQEVADYQEDGSDHPPFDDQGEMTILVLAGTKSLAKAYSKLVSDTLTLAPLVYEDGEHLMLRRTNRVVPILDEDPAPGGGDCWIAHLMFESITAKNL